jgi:hypothetical protein
VEHQQVLADLKIQGKKGMVKKKLTANGWGKHYSLLWQLELVHQDFYHCFTICSLHLLLLGISKVHLLSWFYWKNLYSHQGHVHPTSQHNMTQHDTTQHDTT